MSYARFLVVLILLGPALACAGDTAEVPVRETHASTSWEVTTSEGYDALCIMNALGGDPFYTQFYGRTAADLRARLPQDAVRASERLYRRKQQVGFVLSAFTTLLASTAPADTIDDVIASFEKPGELMRRYRATSYYRPSHGLLFRAVVRRDVIRVLDGLREAGFAEYRDDRRAESLAARIAEIEALVSGDLAADLVPTVERLTGTALPSETITVYVQAYAQPHASRLAGTAFITDYTYPDELILRNTIHELFHPPVEWSDRGMRELLRTLRDVPSLVRAFDEHDPVYGYNYFEGYVEESIVRMLEQLVAEQFGLGMGDPHARWRREDGGMHVLAPVLYSLAREHRLLESGGSVAAFLAEHVTGRPDEIEAMITGGRAGG